MLKDDKDKIATRIVPPDNVDDGWAHLHAIFDALDEGIIFHDLSGTAVAANKAASRLLDMGREEIVKRHASDIFDAAVHPNGEPLAADELPTAITLATGHAVCNTLLGIETIAIGKRWLQLSSAPTMLLDAQNNGVVTTFTDVTDAQESHRALQTAHDRFSALVARSPDMITLIDEAGFLVYASPAFFAMTGVEEHDAIGTLLRRFVHPDDLAAMSAKTKVLVETPGAAVELELRVQAGDGTWRHVEAVAVNHLNDPAIAGIIANSRDVTARVIATKGLAFQATHDPLTGLANRALLLDHLEAALARSSRSGSPISLYYMDLDEFKRVNDSCGHPGGDRLIVWVADQLREITRPGDTIARFGGDEFVMLAEGVQTVTTAFSIAERIKRCIAAPIRTGERMISTTVSIGVALSQAGQDAAALLHEADIALYRAKQLGKNRYELFDEAMRANNETRQDTLAEIRSIIAGNAFALAFDPVVELQSGDVIGGKARIRLNTGQKLAIDIEHAIMAAEQAGLTSEFGKLILDTTCAEAKRRRSAKPSSGWQARLAVSSYQLVMETFVHDVAAILRHYELPASALAFEIGEQELLDVGSAAVNSIVSLARIGIPIAISRFGAAWSSVSQLSEIPIRALKIEPRFVQTDNETLAYETVVRAIVGLGEALGVSVIADGISTIEQAKALAAIGCVEGEGPLYDTYCTTD